MERVLPHQKQRLLRPVFERGLGLPPWAIIILLSTLALVARLTVLRRRRPGDTFAQVDAFAAMEIALVLAVIFLIALKPEFLSRITIALRGTSVRWLGLFFAVATVSAFWSAMPTYTLFRASEFATQFLALLLVLACALAFAQSERILIIAAFAAVLLDLSYGILSFGFGLGGLRSNSYSASAVMLFAYAFGEWLVRTGGSRRQLAVTAVAALALVILGRSMASWWCVLLAISLSFALAKNKRSVFLLIALAVGMLVQIAGVQSLQPLIDPYEELGKIETLHGRTLLWEDYRDTIMANPLLGVGYAIGPRIAGKTYTTNAHNSAIAIILGTGILGGTVIIALLITGTREALYVCSRGRPGAIGTVAALAAGSVNSMSISIFGDAWAPSSFVLMLFYAFFLIAVLRPRWLAFKRPQHSLNSAPPAQTRNYDIRKITA